MFQDMLAMGSGLGGGIQTYTETINAINTPVTTKEIKNGVVVCSMGGSSEGAYGQVVFYATIENGVVNKITSPYGDLPINGTFVSLSYDTTTNKFTYMLKHSSYPLGAITIYVASSITTN